MLTSAISYFPKSFVKLTNNFFWFTFILNYKCCWCWVKNCIASFNCLLVGLIIFLQRFYQISFGAYSLYFLKMIENKFLSVINPVVSIIRKVYWSPVEISLFDSLIFWNEFPIASLFKLLNDLLRIVPFANSKNIFFNGHIN